MSMVNGTVIAVVATIGVCGLCCTCGYFIIFRVLMIDRRGHIKKPMPIVPYIEEKIVEEEKVDPGPERVLTRRELKAQRERERERAAVRTADSNEAGGLGETSPSKEKVVNERAPPTLFESIFFCFVSERIQEEEGEVSLDDLSSLEEGHHHHHHHHHHNPDHSPDHSPDEKKKKKKKDKKDKDNGGKHEVKSERALEAERKRNQRRDDKLKREEAEAKRIAHEEMLAKETPAERHARHEKLKKDKEDKEAAKEEELNKQRRGAIKESMALYFGRRKSSMMFNAPPPRVKEDPEASSLFDLDPEERGRNIVQHRLESRQVIKEKWMDDGVQDVVLENSGPPLTVIPEGYTVRELTPELTQEALQHHRVMVQFDERRAKGWFMGTVSGYTKRPGFNFNVKFDKADTGSIDIDGIKACQLFESGEFAYGRWWCVLDPIPGYVFSQGKSRPGSPTHH